jgi:hypothetical protein
MAGSSKEEEEGLHGVFKQLRRNKHLEVGKLQTAHLRLSLKEAYPPQKLLCVRHDIASQQQTAAGHAQHIVF